MFIFTPSSAKCEPVTYVSKLYPILTKDTLNPSVSIVTGIFEIGAGISKEDTLTFSSAVQQTTLVTYTILNHYMYKEDELTFSSGVVGASYTSLTLIEYDKVKPNEVDELTFSSSVVSATYSSLSLVVNESKGDELTFGATVLSVTLS